MLCSAVHNFSTIFGTLHCSKIGFGLPISQKMVQSALTKLVCRLEAATSRLEDMAHATIDPSLPTSGVANTSGMAVAAARGGDRDSDDASAQNQAPDPLPPALDDFDTLINGDVVKFVNMSEELGGLVAEQVRVIGQKGISSQHHYSASHIIQSSYRADSSSTVCSSFESFCCGTKVFDYHHQS